MKYVLFALTSYDIISRPVQIKHKRVTGMTHVRTFFALLALIVAFTVGCGGGSPSPTAPSAASVKCQWKGQLKVTSGRPAFLEDVTVLLEVDGKTVEGTYRSQWIDPSTNSAGSDSGEVTGELGENQSISLKFEHKNFDWYVYRQTTIYRFQINARVTDQTMTGTFNWPEQDPPVVGNVTLTKQ